MAAAAPARYPSASIERVSGAFYRPELDALRLFAFVAIFLFHSPRFIAAQGMPSVFFGLSETLQLVQRAGSSSLSLFFLLSAYLITELLLRERERTGAIHLRAFYIRRVLRIWPLYYLGVCLGILNGIANQHALQAGEIISLVLFVGYLGRDFHGSPVGPLWSISVEELFYLISPAVAKLRGTLALQTFAVLTVPLALISIAVNPDWYNPFSHFLLFGAGTMLAIVLRSRTWVISMPFRAALCGAGLLLWLALPSGVIPLDGRLLVMAQFLTICAGCTAIFLAFFNLPPAAISEPIRYLGRITYGLYVFHFFCLQEITALFIGMRIDVHRWSVTAAIMMLAFLADIVFASLSYWWFERFFLKWKQRWTLVRSGSAAA